MTTNLPRRRPKAVSVALTVLAFILTVSGVAACLLGITLTVFALGPGTDMVDANILIVVGPVALLLGVALCILAVLWRRNLSS